MTVQVKDSFDVLNELVQEQFKLHQDKQLYTTDVDDLDIVYLNGFEDPAERQYHNCNACKRFIRNFGTLVYIDDQGYARTPFWDVDLRRVPEEFQHAVNEMRIRMATARVTGVFYSTEAKLGMAKNWDPKAQHDWHHFNVILPPAALFRARLETAGQAMAERLQEFQMIRRTIPKYSLDVLAQADALMKADSTLRSSKFRTSLQKYTELVKSRRVSDNHLWAVVAAQDGLARFGSSSVATLLDDIASGKSLDEAKRLFMKVIDPLNYQRAQAAPKIGNLQQAEKAVELLGVAASLKRSVAEFSEVGGLAWLPRQERQTNAKLDVFAGLAKPVMKRDVKLLEGPTMTWLKFANEVLPTAEAIFYEVQPAAKPYCMVTKATDGTAPVIYKWGHNFSWYRWAGGSKPTDFNLPEGREVAVRGIGTLPSSWNSLDAQRQGAILYLEGAQDLDIDKAGLGLYAEALIGDLYSVRSSIEALSKAGTLTSANDPAAGLKITKGEAINIRLGVVVGGIETFYSIDRWD